MGSTAFHSLPVLCALSAVLTAGEAEDELLHDVRAVHDVSLLQLEAVMKEQTGIWLLIRSAPTARSGLATIASYEDPQGALRHGLVVTVEGSWEALASIHPTGGLGRGDYRWDTPIEDADGRGSPCAEMYYSPFVRRGGIALCRFNPRAKGPAQFQPTFLIPPSWQKAVLPAHDFCRKAPDVLKQKAPLKRDSVLELLNGENPLLSVMALRRLMECNEAGADMVKAALHTPDAYKRAVVTYMVLVLPREPQKAGLLDVVSRLVEGCEKADEARPFAVGAFAAALLHSRAEGIASPSREVLRKLRARLDKGDQGGPADPVLKRVFTIRGLEKR